MPYVNIPPSVLTAAIAKITGKIEGEITGAVLKKSKELIDSVNADGCPKDLQRLVKQVNGLNKMFGSIDKRLSQFSRLPKKLKGPLSGLKVALKIILSIPIPQSVPPGFGLPVNITTKYADLLHLVKEFIKQISDDVDALTIITKNSTTQLKSITRNLQKLQVATKVCLLEDKLHTLQEEGKLSIEDMIRLGLLTDDGELITANLRIRAIDLDTYGSLSINGISEKTGLSPQQVVDRLIASNSEAISSGEASESFTNSANKLTGQSQSISGTTGGQSQDDLDAFDRTLQEFTKILKRLDKSNVGEEIKQGLKEVLDIFVDDSDTAKVDTDKFSHTGPNGIVYRLDIIKDPDSPSIAPRRFAVAIDPNNIIVLKGQKSFSSSVDVLLDEIKFRIDNQLP